MTQWPSDRLKVEPFVAYSSKGEKTAEDFWSPICRFIHIWYAFLESWPLFYYLCSFLSLKITPALEFVLSKIIMAIPGLFALMFPWYKLLDSFIFNLTICLHLKCVSYRELSNYIHSKTCTWIFIAFIHNRPKLETINCPSTG